MVANPRIISSADYSTAGADIFTRIGVNPSGIDRMVGKLNYRLIYLQPIPCRCANILKQEMLAIGADAAVAQGTVACAMEVTPVLLMGTDKQFETLCLRLHSQPFGLKEIADEISAVLTHYRGTLTQWCGVRTNLDLSNPLIMAVLNITPDSFSDGGSFLRKEDALDHALRLVDEGADIIDIGGESTRPGSLPVSTEDELMRVIPVIEAIAAKVNIPISIDTTKAEVARLAIDAGAEFVNDISGLTFDNQMASVVAGASAGLVVMHTRGLPETMQLNTEYVDIVSDVCNGIKASIQLAEDAGITREKIAIDPGIGFGKSVEGNLEILQRLREFRSFGLPLLIGTSRKSFISKVLKQSDPLQCGDGTIATVALGVASGAHIYRVHDVRAAKDAAMIAHAVSKGPIYS